MAKASSKNQEPAPTLIRSKTDLWNQLSQLKDAELLKIAVLRDLVMDLHSEKSRLLATQHRAGARNLTLWENRIESLMNHDSLEGELVALIKNVALSSSNTPVIPPALFSVFSKDKILRADRKWEAALLRKSHELNWRFWNLEAWVEIPKIGEWSDTMKKALWPRGIFLFSESAAAAPASPSELTRGFWHGQWWLTAAPEEDLIKTILENLKQWPGTAQKPPSPPQLKHVFPKSSG